MKKLHKVAYIHGWQSAWIWTKEPVAKLVLQMIDLLDELVDEPDDLKDRWKKRGLLKFGCDLADVEDAVFEDDEECSATVKTRRI